MARGVLLLCLLGSGSVSTSVEAKTVSIDSHGDTRSEGSVAMSDERASVAIGAEGSMVPMPPGGGARRSLVREAKQSSPGDTSQSRSISEPDLHESFSALEAQQPGSSLALQSMLSADCAAANEFAWGEKGVDACPAGYTEITDDATCEAGASKLCTGDKCKFFPMAESASHGAIQTGTAPRVCNWCTGCDDGKPVIVDRGHAGAAYWLCKKEGAGGDCDYGVLPGALGPKDTQLNLCSGESVIDFSASSVVHNNLGGSGPDSGPEHIRYASVAAVQEPTQNFLVVDGCPKEAGGDPSHSGQACMSMAGIAGAVRCCSTDGSTCASRTAQGCFGTQKTYQQAVEICTAAGMRLCTATEVATRMCCGTGCMYDLQQVWTSDSCQGAPQERPVDLLVSTTSPGYTPEFSEGNGRQGGMGLISMKSGAKVELKFQFVASGTSTPVTLGSFTFAFLDFDRWVKGKGGLECLRISGFESLEVAPGTEIQMGVQNVGGFRQGSFCASSFGSHFDNPTNPKNLTARQASRAVMFRFSDTSEFSATLSVSAQECGFGRSFMFAGTACLKDGVELTTRTTTTTTGGSTTTTRHPTTRTTTTTTGRTTTTQRPTTRTTTTTTTQRPTTRTTTTTTVREIVTTTNRVSRGHFGLCSLWGDPHFKTFDGAKPITQQEGVTFWIVKSSVFKMMGYSDWGGGTLTRIGLVGGQLGSKKLVVRNNGNEFTGWNDLQVFLDGVRIAQNEGSRFEVGNGVVVSHGSRIEPNYDHVRSEASMWDKVNTAQNAEFVIISFPEGDEVSIAGVIAKVKTKKGKTTLKDPPRMGVTIKLKSEPGLEGACGNFNGNQRDDNTVESNLGSLIVGAAEIPPNVLAEDLHSSLARSSLDSGLHAARAPKTYAQVRAECNAVLLASADEACKDLPESEVIEACVFDICVSGDVEFGMDAALIEVLRVVQGDGVVTEKSAEGKCLDQNGLTYASLAHVSIDTADKCEELLELLGKIEGVEGAQLGPNSNCEILFDPNTGTSEALKHEQEVLRSSRMWGAEQPGTGGSQLVKRTSLEAGWRCWEYV